MHKPNCPLRPIISNVGTATRSLAGWLSQILSPYLGKFSTAHLKNSIDFKERLNRFALNNSTNTGKLLSLDVTALFTNVPTNDVLQFLGRKIDSAEINIPIPKQCFLGLIRLCVENNVFQFNDNYYKQKFGISMGSPLSPVLANLYMEYFESELLPSLSPQPSFWVRYVDDVLIMWPDQHNFQLFFNSVNSLANSIKFTTESEIDQRIPFLDVTVHRHPSGFTYSIYRKPTHSNQYIHYFSWHPDHVKRSSVFSLFLRAYRLCDHPHLDTEINYIYKSFKNVGFPTHVIDAVHSSVKAKFFSQHTRQQEEEDHRRPTISLPHNQFVQKYVAPIFHANKYRVVNNSQGTLRSRLVHNKPVADSEQRSKSGVYNIPCKNCPQVYYGETGRGLDTRIREHKLAVRRGDRNNAMFRHSFEARHDIDWNNASIIYPSSSHYDRLVFESACIISQPNFNHLQSTLGIDKFSAEIILKSNNYIPHIAPD